MASVPVESLSSNLELSAEASNYYHTSDRRNLLGHLSFGVSSYTTSQKFYTSILAPFGVSLVYSDPTRKILGYGFEAGHEIINLFERSTEARPPGPGTHFAFNAPSREAVRTFWRAGVANGGQCAGEPGIRLHYGANYFAAFLWDPDGFKLEAVFQETIKEDKGVVS
ncbi:Glyoxalase/Bleomycin resistance protein/Dihydroxybiphenyl dioxygenase [Tricladium varicosporioides]|nr:Glyoxalase/Bleomycin resistance protein/Dihydroxybiphenyl dioxygenase [Hymenoscyphus varicosporioides]